MKHKGYILPDDHQPEGYYCLTVRIPRDVMYLRAFFGALDFFGKWLAWDDGGDGRATEAAAIWKTANELTRASWKDCPTESEDGMCCCGDRITVPAPWPDSETGSKDAPANIIKNVLQPLAEMAIDNCGVSKAQYVADATAWMRQFDPNWSAAAVLSEIYDQMCALDPSEQDYYLDDGSYCDQFCALQECAGNDGLWDLLDCLNAQINEWLDSTNTTLMDWLNKAAALMTGNGWQNAAGYGGAGGGAGFDIECECGGWCVELTPENGLENLTSPSLTGGYVVGQGWQAIDPTNPDQLFLRLEFAAATITRVGIGRTVGMDGNLRGWWGTPNQTIAGGMSPFLLGEALLYAENSVSPTATTFIELGNENSGAGSPEPLLGYINLVRVCGTGANPFV